MSYPFLLEQFNKRACHLAWATQVYLGKVLDVDPINFLLQDPLKSLIGVLDVGLLTHAVGLSFNFEVALELVGVVLAEFPALVLGDGMEIGETVEAGHEHELEGAQHHVLNCGSRLQNLLSRVVVLFHQHFLEEHIDQVNEWVNSSSSSNQKYRSRFLLVQSHSFAL